MWFGNVQSRTVSRSATAEGEDTSNLSSYSFSSVAIGTAAATRRVVVCLAMDGAGGRSVSAVTVGGISATQVESAANNNLLCDMWVATVPTGTTATIAVTITGGSVTRCMYAVYALYNTLSATATFHSDDITSAYSISTTIAANSVTIAMFGSRGGGTSSWTNATEDYDSVSAEGGTVLSTASRADTASTTSSISVIPSVADDSALVVGVWA